MSQTTSDPRIGSVLAGYRIERLLGRGGMGVVYLAHDPRLKRNVALKLLAPELANDDGFRERFLHESELAASLDHQNVIPIYEAGEADGVLFIAMRYVEGTDLARLLADEGPLEPARTVGILAQVASALDTAHQLGLVHRDVKPSNILLAADEHVYLADFGLTRTGGAAGPTAEYATSLGTVDYVAPEQIDGDPLDAQADLYSLGCVLYECLTGQPPYRADTSMGVLWSHLQADPPSAHEIRPELPDQIDTVIAHALAKQPNDRHHTCTELVRNASAALGTTPLLRRREFLVAAGLVLAAAIAAPAALLTRTGGGSGPSLATRNSLARIDPATGRIMQVVSGLAPAWTFAIGEGAAWWLSLEKRSVTRVDPATGASSVSTVPGLVYGIAAGEGTVWVTTRFEGRGYLLAMNPATGNIDRRYPLPYSDPLGVTVDAGSIWVVCFDFLHAQSRILRYPPRPELTGDTTVPEMELSLPASPWWTTITDWFAVADGRISILTGVPGTERPTLRQIDAASGDELLAVSGFEYPEALTVAPGRVWVTETVMPVVFEVLPSGEKVRHEGWVTLDTGPLHYAHGSLWLGDLLENDLKRIDTTTGEVTLALQVAEPRHAERAGPTYVGLLEGPFLTGLRSDGESLWAQVGGVPGNVV